MTPVRVTAAHVCWGLTLVEMLVSTVLVGVLLVAALNTVGTARMGQRKLYERRQGQQLAATLMAEILAQPYADETQIDNLKSEILVNGRTVSASLGPEFGENLAGNRAAFDDIDDYQGWSASPPQERSGTPQAQLAGWQRSVAVAYVQADDVSVLKGADEGAKRVTVSVAHEGVPVAELVALRTLGPPPTEVCCLADGSALDMLPAQCLALGGKPGGPGTNSLNYDCRPPALVAHWKFDEGSGTSATDGVNQFTATLYNGLGWTTGHTGSALKLDGNNDYGQAPHDDRLSITEEITLAAWIYKLSNTSWDVAFSKGTVEPHHNYSLATYNNNIVFEFHDGNQYWHSTSSFTIATKRWYHVAVTYNDAANTVKIYLDGQLRDTLTCAGSLVTNNEPLRFGACTTLSGVLWHGYLDDVYIYSRVLIDDEVLTLYNGGEP